MKQLIKPLTDWYFFYS